jgi:hypothetical protein
MFQKPLPRPGKTFTQSDAWLEAQVFPRRFVACKIAAVLTRPTPRRLVSDRVILAICESTQSPG